MKRASRKLGTNKDEGRSFGTNTNENSKHGVVLPMNQDKAYKH